MSTPGVCRIKSGSLGFQCLILGRPEQSSPSSNQYMQYMHHPAKTAMFLRLNLLFLFQNSHLSWRIVLCIRERCHVWLSGVVRYRATKIITMWCYRMWPECFIYNLHTAFFALVNQHALLSSRGDHTPLMYTPWLKMSTWAQFSASVRCLDACGLLCVQNPLGMLWICVFLPCFLADF